MPPTDLLAYGNGSRLPAIRPAPVRRPWMDETAEAHAYRCLPLDIANAHGWEVLSPASFEAWWDGSSEPDGVHVSSSAEAALLPVGHFGSGILTFDLQMVFRTSPRWNLWVTGPVNAAKDGIAPLSAVVETDWLPYGFSMSWRFTRPDHRVRFEEGEAFCHFFPLPRGYLGAIHPELHDLAEAPELEREARAWAEARQEAERIVGEDPTADSRTRWHDRYRRGNGAPSHPAAPNHEVKLRLRPFSAPGGGAETPGPATSRR
jgi:hypothetical protein